jgi:hypothetical protein
MADGVMECVTCGWQDHDVEFLLDVAGVTVGLLWTCEACDTAVFQSYEKPS